MSIIKYKAKKSKTGYLYKVRIYRVIDGKRHDYFKSGFKTLREAKQYGNIDDAKEILRGAHRAPECFK